MTMFVFPKFPVSRWDVVTGAYIQCGTITNINVKSPDAGTNIMATGMLSSNSIVKDGLPAAMFNPTSADNEVMARLSYVPTARLQTITYNSSIDVTIQLDTAVTLNKDTVHVLFKTKFEKNTKETLTMTVGDVEGLVVPVKTMLVDHRYTSIHKYGPMQPGVKVVSEDSWIKVVYENLYSTKLDDDSTFVATQVRFTSSYGVDMDDIYIYLNVDMLTGIITYIRLYDIYKAYYAKVGKGWGFTPRLIIRTVTNPIVVYPKVMDIPESPPIEKLYDYSVGIITQVKDFVLSEDGLTISGKFNAKCNIAMTFNNGAPINIASANDGSFTYTGTVNMNVGGQLKLIPSNLIGEHNASVLTIADKVAPLAINNATVTANGVYGTAEIGAIINLYDESDTLLKTYTVPVGGLVEILFDSPIESDITYKLFRYSISDVAGNILGQQLLEFTGTVNDVTGPIYNESYEYSGVQLIKTSSEVG